MLQHNNIPIGWRTYRDLIYQKALYSLYFTI
jgi:hypothetical protein